MQFHFTCATARSLDLCACHEDEAIYRCEELGVIWTVAFEQMSCHRVSLRLGVILLCVVIVWVCETCSSCWTVVMFVSFIVFWRCVLLSCWTVEMLSIWCRKFLFLCSFPVHCNASRVKREYPDPDPIFRVPVFSGSKILLVSSGVSLSNPKFLLPEKPDPIIRVYPNAQHDRAPTHGNERTAIYCPATDSLPCVFPAPLGNALCRAFKSLPCVKLLCRAIFLCRASFPVAVCQDVAVRFARCRAW
jgi:hypothetical protein